MTTIKSILTLKYGILLFMFLMTAKGFAQSQPWTIGLTLGQVVTNPAAAGDSLFKAKADIFLGDSLNVSKVRLVVFNEASVSLLDKQYSLNELPTVDSPEAWKEGYIVHIAVPDYNPTVKIRFFVELLEENGQLLMQIEKEF